MKSYLEIEAFAMNVKEFHYSKGTGYNFSFAMKGEAQSEDRKSAPTVWISAVSFNQPILDKRNYLLRGKQQVKPPYNESSHPKPHKIPINTALNQKFSKYFALHL